MNGSHVATPRPGPPKPSSISLLVPSPLADCGGDPPERPWKIHVEDGRAAVSLWELLSPPRSIRFVLPCVWGTKFLSLSHYTFGGLFVLAVSITLTNIHPKLFFFKLLMLAIACVISAFLGRPWVIQVQGSCFSIMETPSWCVARAP